MIELKITNNQVTLIDDEDFELISSYRWHASYNTKLKGYYAVTCINDKTTYMHRLIMGFPEKLDVDHINKNTLDNRKENLRICTRSQNQCNRPKASHNKSGYKGVWYDKYRGKWCAKIQLHYKSKLLGRFNSPEEAALIRDIYAYKIHGEFAYLNFPDKKNEFPDVDIENIFIKCIIKKASKYNGVCITQPDSFQTNISINGKTIKMPVVHSEIIAAISYDEMSILYPSKGRNKLNFPHYTESCNIDPSIINDIHIIPSPT